MIEYFNVDTLSILSIHLYLFVIRLIPDVNDRRKQNCFLAKNKQKEFFGVFDFCILN